MEGRTPGSSPSYTVSSISVSSGLAAGNGVINREEGGEAGPVRRGIPGCPS